MSKNLHITSRIIIPASELRYTFSRSSGPGGQKVNKTSSKVTLHWAINSTVLSDEVRDRIVRRHANRIGADGELSISSDRHRLQSRNREECLAKLREIILSALRKPKSRVATVVSKGAKEKRLTQKKKRGMAKRLRRSRPDLGE